MQIFTVHQRADDVVFVREGFTFWGFALGLLWLLYRRLWLASLLVLLVQSVLMSADEKGWMQAEMVAVLQLVMGLIIGFQGRDWQRERLASKGYSQVDVVVSDSELRAQQRYFDRTLPASGLPEVEMSVAEVMVAGVVA